MHFIVTCFTIFLLESTGTYQTGCSHTENTYMFVGRLIELELKLRLLADTVTYLGKRNSELSASVLQLSGENVSLNKTVSSQQMEIERLENRYFNESGKGSTYVRWGRSTCPGNGSDIVYQGYVGGYNDNNGDENANAAANYLCLPEDPEWKIFDVVKASGSKLSGSKYKARDVDLTPFLGPDRENKYPLCVVCSTVRSRVLMIPGKTSCKDGWEEEYDGYLVSDSGENKASEFICLDDNAEYREGSDEITSGHFIYLAEAKCGSLPCPPYIEGREITCVVCSK